MEIICDQCGAVLAQPEWKTLREGDIEHTYFVCDACGAAFSVSVTDGKLRKRIEDYTKLAARIKKGHCSEQFHRKVQRLKEENVMRSRELAKLHPLAPLLLQE